MNNDSIKKVFYNDNIKTKFNENNNILTENNLSRENPISDLVDIYYKKMEIKNNNQKIFICNNEDIESEENKNKKIKNYIKDSDNKLNVSVIDKGSEIVKKIKFYENNCLSFKIYLSNKSKVSDLIDIYYEKTGIKNENKKSFVCDGNILNQEENKFIGDIKQDFSELKVFVE